jgi:maltose/moltooligosaccharide transporter
MSTGFLGIQVGWGMQMGNMSAIYEYLGAKPDEIPLLWLAAPDDRTHCTANYLAT